MGKQRNRTLTIIIGVITALAVVLSQIFYFSPIETCKKEEVKTEKQSKSSEEQQPAFSTPVNSVLSQIHVELNNEIILLFEIIFEKTPKKSLFPGVPVSLGKYFRVLFPGIISPNAP